MEYDTTPQPANYSFDKKKADNLCYLLSKL